jgi:Undecaprenyl-phosphate galactose phosphotransferase WbaP
MTARTIPFSRKVNIQSGRPVLIGLKNRRWQMGLLMLAADLIGIGVAVGSVWLANEFVHLFTFQPSDLKYSIIPLICLLLFMNSRLYPGVGISPPVELKLVSQYTGLSYTIGIIFFSVIQAGWELNFFVFFAVGGLSLLTIVLTRWGTRILASRLGLWGEPVLMLGHAREATELSCYFCQRLRLGFIPVIATDDTVRRKCPICPIPAIKLDTVLRSQPNRFIDAGIHTVVVDSWFAATLLGSKELNELLRLFQHVIFISDMDWLEGASLSIHDYEGLVGVEAKKNKLSTLDTSLKRSMDILFTLLIGLFSLPIMLTAAILIKFDSPGPVFYQQRRLGKRGEVINIYKFRTMVRNADHLLAEYLAAHPEARQEWEQDQKLRHDPRITRIGHYLRKFSIDELPQLLNVLKGDMSLIGPRPIVESETHHYGDKIDVYKSVCPGVTGLWQASGRNHASYEQRVRYDTYYVRNWSVWLDLYILFRTVWVVLSRDGAY